MKFYVNNQRVKLRMLLLVMMWKVTRRFPIIRPYSTKTHIKIWENRQIDWKKDYLSTVNHPHRGIITGVLKPISFHSLWEVGMGPGANIARIVQDITTKTDRQIVLGGSDVNKEAIKVANEAFTGGLFHVERGDKMLMSDKAVDIILTDATLIYVGPFQIRKYLREFKRIARLQVIMVELDSKSWWYRWSERLHGNHLHNYRRLLEKEGYSFIQVRKIPGQYYPEETNRSWSLIVAKP